MTLIVRVLPPGPLKVTEGTFASIAVIATVTVTLLPTAAAGFIKQFEDSLPEHARIGSVTGRYFAMDRDKRWDRVARAYNAIVEAEAPRFPDARSAIADADAHDLTDEFIEPSVIVN